MTVVFIVEAHSQSEKVEVCMKIKRNSIAGECLLSNHAVLHKGKSGHHNCIDWRKTCPHGQVVLYISRTHDFEPNVSAKKCSLYTSFYSITQKCGIKINELIRLKLLKAL